MDPLGIELSAWVRTAIVAVGLLMVIGPAVLFLRSAAPPRRRDRPTAAAAKVRMRRTGRQAVAAIDALSCELMREMVEQLRR